MRKALSIIVAIGMIIVFIPVSFANDVAVEDSNPLIKVGSATGVAGEVAQIPVIIQNNPGVAGVQLLLIYDSRLTLTSVAQSKGEEDSALESLNFNAPGDISQNPLTLSLDGLVADATNGKFLVLTFTLPEDAANSTVYEIQLSYNKGDIYDDNLEDLEFEIVNGGIEVAPHPKEVKGAKIVIADAPENDVLDGAISFDASNRLFMRSEPETVTGNNLMYESPGVADFDTMRVQAGPENDRRWAAFTATYYRPKRTDSLRASGSIPFNVDEFTASDNTLTFEIEYFDNGTGSISLRYVTGDMENNRVSIPRTNDGTWKIWLVTVNDAVFDNSKTTGLGVSNSADFRLEGADIYISSIKVYTTDTYDQLKPSANKLTLDGIFDANGVSVARGKIEADFKLPVSIGGESDVTVNWESSDEAFIKIDGGNAKVTRGNFDEEVTLTAKIIKGNYYISKAFELIVKADVIVQSLTSNGYWDQPFSPDVKQYTVYVNTSETSFTLSSTFKSGKMLVNDTELLSGSSVSVALTQNETEVYISLCDSSGNVVIYVISVIKTNDALAVKYSKTDSGYVFDIGLNNAAVSDFEKANLVVALYDGEGSLAKIVKTDVLPGETKKAFDVETGIVQTAKVMLWDASTAFKPLCSAKSINLFNTVKHYDLNGSGSNIAMFNDYINNAFTDNHNQHKRHNCAAQICCRRFWNCTL